MKKYAFGMILAVLAVNALAGGSASVTCSSAHYPVIWFSYSPDGDVGVPGLIFVGVLDKSRSSGAVLRPGDYWTPYQGGSFPFYGAYTGGLPGSVSTVLNFPNGSQNTSEYVGYTLYGGHGAFTAEYRAKALNFISQKDSTKAELMKNGAWTVSNELNAISSMRIMQAAVEHDFTQNGKGIQLLKIPYLDCKPPPP